MKSDINDLCEAFLAALTNAGYAVKSIENYKQVSNRFKKFCAENGYDTYTVNIRSVQFQAWQQHSSLQKPRSRMEY